MELQVISRHSRLPAVLPITHDGSNVYERFLLPYVHLVAILL